MRVTHARVRTRESVAKVAKVEPSTRARAREDAKRSDCSEPTRAYAREGVGCVSFVRFGGFRAALTFQRGPQMAACRTAFSDQGLCLLWVAC